MEPAAILTLAWSLLKNVSLGVGINELHRQLVNRLRKSDAASLNLQKALHHSLLRAVDTLGEALSAESHPYFQSISNLQERREEQQRVKETFKAIRAQFPTTGTLQRPVVVLLEDDTWPDTRRLLGKLGLEDDLASLPEVLRNSLEANLPLVMLAHFRQQVATDEGLRALLQLDVTTAGFQAVQRELHLISTFLYQHCGSADPAKIRNWPENLTTELKVFIAGEFAEVKEKVAIIERKVDELPQKILAVLSAIYDPRETQHLRAGFYPLAVPSTWVGASLPYHQLGGPGLERLCYLLLLDEGKVPRYFGKPGQKQYGIDLLVTHGDETTVYQCKNERSFPLQNMKAALQHFEAEWLDRPELPRPTGFVLCCPLPLQERWQNEAWTTLERKFQARTGVSVTFWDRNYLDERLRHLPDVVADLFSDRVAEQFCNLDDWNRDLFRPLVASSGERNIDRYLAQKEAGRLYLDPKLVETFTQKLELSGSLLIRGLPGTGKTVTGLALAESLRHRHGPYRIFYINLRHDIDEDTLVQGVRRRLTQRTIFFFDDCHGKYDLLDRVQNRLRPILAERPGRGLLIFTARTTPTLEGMPRGDRSDFEESLAENEAVLEFQPTRRLFRQIITLAKPHFAGLSKERLQKIFDFTGHDLFLLNQLLETLDSPDEIDRLAPKPLFEKTLIRYFGSPTVYRPGFRRLAALAQFDLSPPVASFDSKLDQEDEKAASQLLVVADRRPPRYYFLHSSAAELVFRALAWNDGIDDHPALAADYLVAFFKSRLVNYKQLAEYLANVLHKRLGLKHDDIEENRLKSRFLADDNIYALIEKAFEQLPLNLLSLCLFILTGTGAEMLERYHDLVQRKVDDGTVLGMIIRYPLHETHQFLQLIKRWDQVLHSSLQSQLATYRGLRLLITTAAFPHVLSLLTNLSEPDNSQWAISLDMIADHEFDEMIQRTVASGRSIGTLGLKKLRKFKRINPALLEELERKIGAERYLHLITSAGTISDLFKVIQYSSSSIKGELIEAVDAETLDVLIAQTIASGRSIGTIDLALRELKKTDPDLLEELERKIGAERYLYLVNTVGTIFELFRVIQRSSPSMAGELIEALNAEMLDALIAQTIASDRSIGTIDWTLRELKKTSPVLLEKLESKIGAERYLHLIASVGTIYELFKTIEHSSPSMVRELIEALNAETLDALITQTIASGRSIGTIHLALRELKETDPDLSAKLERKIGAERWWQLICANGNMQVLTSVLQYLDRLFRQEWVESSQQLSLDEWQALLLRGDFADLCNFVRWKAHLFSTQFTPAFLNSLEPTFETLIRQESWEGLAQGAGLLRVASESLIRQHLLDLLHDYVATVKLSELRFDSFDEAAACASVLWHQFPSQRQALLNSLLTVLPEENAWYTSERFLRSARQLFFIVANPQARPDDARQVLSIGNDQAVAPLCPEATTLDLFLYLWNLYSLWFQWKEDREKTFADFLHPAIRKAVTGALVERFQTKADQAEIDNLIALVGFISFNGLAFDPAEKADWTSTLPSLGSLAQRASSKTFVPAVFFLLGLEWIFERDIFPRTWQCALLKADEYAEKPAALEHLCDLARARAARGRS